VFYQPSTANLRFRCKDIFRGLGGNGEVMFGTGAGLQATAQVLIGENCHGQG
jgi:hypothetical protein